MTKNNFLDVFVDFTKDAIKDFLLPVSPREDEENKERIPDVYKMRLPDRSSATKKAPYILHQVVTTSDKQNSGSIPYATVTIRTVFCIYHPSEGNEGPLALLELIERLRIAVLKSVSIGKVYQLDREAGLESLIYPEDTAPYYVGEMISVWKVPHVLMEVMQWLPENL